MRKNVMHRKKPELVDVRVIPWNDGRGLFGIETVFDDGVVEREVWGDLGHTQLTVALRRLDIHHVRSPRRSLF
jgi:hypothetical protein